MRRTSVRVLSLEGHFTAEEAFRLVYDAVGYGNQGRLFRGAITVEVTEVAPEPVLVEAGSGNAASA